MKYSIMLLLTLVTIPGCAKSIKSDIQSYSTLTPSQYAGKTIAIIPAVKDATGTLEFADFASKIGQKLASEGLRQVSISNIDSADYIAVVNYGIDSGRTETVSGAIPQYGQTGYSSSNTYGTINSYGNNATYNGTTSYNPSYGITGYIPYTNSQRVFARTVTLDIYDRIKYDNKLPAMVYQAKAISEGSCSNMAAVFGPMTEALLADFPRASTGSKTIEMDPDIKC